MLLRTFPSRVQISVTDASLYKPAVAAEAVVPTGQEVNTGSSVGVGVASSWIAVVQPVVQSFVPSNAPIYWAFTKRESRLLKSALPPVKATDDELGI